MTQVGNKEFYLEDGERMVTCPYDASHYILETRMWKHLPKCRRNYITMHERMGIPAMWIPCKYECGKELLVPELFDHERVCDKKPPYIGWEDVMTKEELQLWHDSWIKTQEELLPLPPSKFPVKDKKGPKQFDERLAFEDYEDWGHNPRPTFSLFKPDPCVG